MINAIGAIGSMLLAACSFPQVYQCYKNKSAKGINMSFIMMWWIGLILVANYSLFARGFDIYLHTQYLINFLACSVIMFYKIKDRR